MLHRGLLVWILPVTALVLLGAVIHLRIQEAPVRPAPHSLRRSGDEIAGSKATLAPVPTSPGATVSKEAALSAQDEGALRGTFQNYRTAVATGNEALRKGLERVLRRNPDAALRLAQEALQQARTPRDREIAQELMLAFRRSP